MPDKRINPTKKKRKTKRNRGNDAAHPDQRDHNIHLLLMEWKRFLEQRLTRERENTDQ